MKMSRALTKVLPRQCGVNTQGLLYIGKKGCEMIRQQAAEGGGDSSALINEQSPQGICWTKSQILCYSLGLGGGKLWLQMSSSLVLKLDHSSS